MCQTSNLDRPCRTTKNQGQNWISPNKRLALYMRDGFECAYCGKGIETGIVLTLDHLQPYSLGGALLDPANLITACRNCNSARNNRSVEEFVVIAAQYHQREATQILEYIATQTVQELSTKAAAALIKHRGSCRKVLDIVQAGDPIN